VSSDNLRGATSTFLGQQREAVPRTSLERERERERVASAKRAEGRPGERSVFRKSRTSRCAAVDAINGKPRQLPGVSTRLSSGRARGGRHRHRRR